MRHFDVPFKQTSLHGTIFGTMDPRILFIHGASQEGSARFDMLRQHLSKTGINSAAFDFIGAGQTGGEWFGSSLKERFEQSRTVLDTVHIQKPLILVGLSMGAHIAILLTKIYPVSTLILFVPQVYAHSAYTTPFTENLSLNLHSDRSWEGSDTWDILKEFTGSLLVIGAEQDALVPKEMFDHIDASTPNAKHKELLIVPGAPHRIFPYLDEHHKEFARVFERVYHTIVSTPLV